MARFKSFAFSEFERRVSVSPNAIRRARPGFTLIFAGNLATSGAEACSEVAVGGGDFVTSGAAGGSDIIFGAGGNGVDTNGGGGGAAVFSFAAGGGGVDFEVAALADLSGLGFDSGFGAVFLCAGFRSVFLDGFVDVLFRAAVGALSSNFFFGAM